MTFIVRMKNKTQICKYFSLFVSDKKQISINGKVLKKTKFGNFFQNFTAKPSACKLLGGIG